MANDVTEKAFSDLDTAGQLDNTDIFALSKVSGSGYISAKTSLTALATKIATDVNFTSELQTTSKILTGAINEIAQGGGGGGVSELDDLSDVDIDSLTLANGQTLIYDSQTQTFKNAAGGGGSSSLSGLTDTTISNPADGQFLVYDGTSSKWVNLSISSAESESF